MGCSSRKCSTSHDTKCWFNTDACGLACAVVTYLLIVYAVYVVHWQSLPSSNREHWDYFHLFIFDLLAFLAAFSHFRAMTCDPGSVPLDAKPPPDYDTLGSSHRYREQARRRRCRRCDSFKPERAHHCSICKRCVVKMDHHCPWVNNCVGVSNHKFFLLFLLYIFLVSIYAIFILIRRYGFLCYNISEDDDHIALSRQHSKKIWGSFLSDRTNRCYTSVGGIALQVLLLIEAFLFGLFTICMIYDQREVITKNVAKIDRMKAKRDERDLDVEASIANEVFGGYNNGVRIDWLIPTKPVFPASLVEDIYGFVVPPTNHFTPVVDETGKTYYWNEQTGETTWELPPNQGSIEMV